MALRDDDAARAFGKAVIRDMMAGEAARYAGWTMNITKGGRAVCCLPFSSPLNTWPGVSRKTNSNRLSGKQKHGPAVGLVISGAVLATLQFAAV